MGEVHELIDINTVGRLFAVLAVAGPMIGAVAGGLAGSRSTGWRRGSICGAMWGAIGTLTWLMWKVYNSITDRLGLDSVKNLLVNLMLFVIVGILVGAAAARLARSSPIKPDAKSEESNHPV